MYYLVISVPQSGAVHQIWYAISGALHRMWYVLSGDLGATIRCAAPDVACHIWCTAPDVVCIIWCIFFLSSEKMVWHTHKLISLYKLIYITHMYKEFT